MQDQSLSILDAVCGSGDSNIGWSGRPLLASRPKKPEPPASPTRTSSGPLSGKSTESGTPNIRPVVWTRYYTIIAWSSMVTYRSVLAAFCWQAFVFSPSDRTISSWRTNSRQHAVHSSCSFVRVYTSRLQSIDWQDLMRLPPCSDAEQVPAAHTLPNANGLGASVQMSC